MKTLETNHKPNEIMYEHESRMWRFWRNLSKRHHQTITTNDIQKLHATTIWNNVQYHCQRHTSHHLRKPAPMLNPPFQSPYNRLAKRPLVLWVIRMPFHAHFIFNIISFSLFIRFIFSKFNPVVVCFVCLLYIKFWTFAFWHFITNLILIFLNHMKIFRKAIW